MIKFYSSYNVPPSLAEPECPKEKDELIYDEVQEKIVKVGTIPFYEEIQSHYESTRLDHKIEQFRRGNALALGVPNDTFIDTTNIPNNLAQVLQSRETAREEFDKLPENIRKLFRDDFSEFAKSLSDGSYESKLNDYAKGVIEDARAKVGTPGSGKNEGGDN